MPPLRPFDSWLLVPPSPTGDVFNFMEPASRPLIWKWLDHWSNNAAEGRKLFAGNLAAKNRLWREFHNFARQARVYDDAADNVIGSSSGLLQYYALLNLAKAELLVTNSAEVLTQPFRHGLSYRRSAGDSIAGDALVVHAGAFPLLYEKRTGVALPIGTRLDVKRLLRHVPEIGWEVERAGLDEPETGRFFHSITFDGENSWALLAVQLFDKIRDSAVSVPRFTPHFEQIDPPHNWREVFGLTRRSLTGGFTFFQSRWSRPRVLPHGAIAAEDVVGVAAETWQRLAPLLDLTTDPAADAFVTPSLLRSRWIAMPPSLARYALMFYVSSLVRYAPGKLDPVRQPGQAWLFDSFADEAHVPLLINALNGISETPVLFHPRAAFRN